MTRHPKGAHGCEGRAPEGGGWGRGGVGASGGVVSQGPSLLQALLRVGQVLLAEHVEAPLQQRPGDVEPQDPGPARGLSHTRARSRAHCVVVERRAGCKKCCASERRERGGSERASREGGLNPKPKRVS